MMIVTEKCYPILKSRFPLVTVIRTVKAFKPAPDELDLPEFTYAGKNIKPHTRVHVMGVTTHGALGVRDFIRPLKGKAFYKYVHHPHRLDFADKFQIQDIACGYGFTVFAVKADNKISPFFGTGIASNCQIGFHGRPQKIENVVRPTTIDIPLHKRSTRKKVACGRAHTMIWTDSEGLWTFGNNSYGQCGRPIVKHQDYSARAFYHHVARFDHRDVQQIECGQDTSFVLCDGKVYSCGWSADGQTGRGGYDNVAEFGPVEGDLKGERVVKLSSKADCVLALTDNGDVFGWGNCEYRQLGSRIDKQQECLPQRLHLPVDGKVIDVAAAGSCSFLVTDCGNVWSLGYGILGRGPECRSSEEPELIPSTLLGRTVLSPDTKVTKIFAGVSTAAAVTDEGGLFTWGRNVEGCLGLGHTNFQHFPMRVCVTSNVLKASCGLDHTMVITKSLM